MAKNSDGTGLARAVSHRIQYRFLAAFILAACIVAQAQNLPPENDRGLLPGNSYSISDVENINLNSGTLFLQIPLVRLPPGPAGSSTGISLLYNSDIYDFTQSFKDWPTTSTSPNTINTMLQSTTGGGWTYGYQYSLLYELGGLSDTTCSTATYRYRTSAVFPDGSKHVLYLNSVLNSSETAIPIDNAFDINGYFLIGPSGKYPCGSPIAGVANVQGPATLVYFTQDNTFVRVEVSLDSSNNQTQFFIYFLDGRQVHGTCTGGGCLNTDTIKDKDGNAISISPTHLSDNWEPVVTITDSLGRSISITNNFPVSGAQPAQPVDTIKASGFGGSLETTVFWAGYQSANTFNQGSGQWTYSYECVQNPGSGISGNCPSPDGSVGALNPGAFAISSITLPSALGTLPGSTRGAGDGILQYTFGYSVSPGWGQLNNITSPLGEIAHYTYASDGQFVLGGLPQPPIAITAKSLTYVDPSGTQRSQHWTYLRSGLTVTVTNPDGGSTVHGFGVRPGGLNATPANFSEYEQQPNNVTIDRIYSPSCAVPNYGSDGNFFLSAELHTFGTQTAITTYGYDRNGNITSRKEYDWIPASSLPPRDGNNFITSLPSLGTPKRTTTNTYFNQAGAATGCLTLTDDSNGYWHHQSTLSSSSTIVPPRNELKTSVVTDGMTTGTTAFTYDANGDVLTKTVYTDSSATIPLNTTFFYDAFGNLTKVTDPNGGNTQYTYVDGCVTPSYVSKITDALGHVTQQTWDCTTGLILTRTDPNGVETLFSNGTSGNGYDVWGRPTKRQEAAGTSDQRTTTYSYITANTSAASTLPISILETEDLLASNDGLLKTTTQLNQLGEVYSVLRGNVTTQHLSPLVGTDSSGSDKSTNSCAANSSGTFTYNADSNPFFSTSDATMGWTRKKYDQNSRLVALDHFAGAGAPFPWGSNSSNSGSQSWCYTNNVTTVSDESSKTRKQTVDGLGRLINVNEDPSGLNYTTNYTYDFGDRLKSVTQTDANEGAQTRTFVYDSAGRLTSASNPESGTISYQSDGNGNVTQRSDSRVTANFTYDLLNRVKTKTYARVSTPAVTYCYDALPSSPGTCASSATSGFIGRLTEVYSTASETDYLTFDNLGRVKSSKQVTGSLAPGTFSYTYTPQGTLLSETYPSGRAITYTLDSVDGRVTKVAGTSVNYAQNIAYWAQGAVQQMQRGDTLFENWTYNDRLQPTLISLGPTAGSTTTASFAFHYCASGTICSANNGNVLNQGINPLGPSDVYTYDGVNRVQSATEGTSWTQNFAYDAFGNRAVVATSTYIPNTGFTPQVPSSTSTLPYASNRWSGATYDGSGNLSALNGFTYSYDAENRQTQAVQTVNSTTTTSTYTYDGDGKRVTRVAGGATTTYVYDAQGHLAAEYATSAPTDSDCRNCYLTMDHLGSARVITDGSGNFVARHDYAPFGEELLTSNRPAGLGYGATSTVNQKFTGKERDSETGLDYFGARYMSSAQGRFTSPDPGGFGSALADPQSWNAYAYGRNNPLKYTDPTGLAYTVCQTDSDGNKSNCGTVDDKNDKAFLQSLNDSGLSMTAGGRILNGSGDQIGTASYFSQAQQNSDSQAAQFLTNQVGPLVNGLGYATGGVLLGAGAGAAYGAIAGGSTALSIPVTSGGTATAAGYQLLKDSYKNLELAGEALSGVGQRIIAAGDEIRDVPRLVSQYGGKASDWVKLSTSGIDPSKMQIYAQQAGRGTPIQMHYYKNIATGAIVEMKSVFTGIQ